MSAAVTWRSPRPMSAAGLVRQAGGGVFVKRHDPRVRSTAQPAAEHASPTEPAPGEMVRWIRDNRSMQADMSTMAQSCRR